MFDMSLPWWEFVLRAAMVFLGILLLLRIVGKRQFGQLTPFDIILLLLISEGASNALGADDNSLTAALLVIATLLLLDWTLGMTAARSRRLNRALEGRPRFLVRNGRVDYALLRAEGITHNDLLANLRKAGCFSPKEVDYAVLETSGEISVRSLQDRPDKDLTRRQH